jgi:hypothetical protein
MRATRRAPTDDIDMFGTGLFGRAERKFAELMEFVRPQTAVLDATPGVASAPPPLLLQQQQ